MLVTCCSEVCSCTVLMHSKAPHCVSASCALGAGLGLAVAKTLNFTQKVPALLKISGIFACGLWMEDAENHDYDI